MRSFHSLQFCGSSKMTNLLLLFVALAIAGVYGETTIEKITMKKVNVEMNSNPYFDTFAASLSPGGETLSLKTPVKKDLPPSVMVKILITAAGIELPESEMPLCESFSDRAVGADIFAAGIPKGKFPKNCPVVAGEDYEIHQYQFPPNKLPPGTPPGPVSGKFFLYEPGMDPYVTISVEGQLDSNMSDGGIPGMKPPGFG